MTFRRSPTLDRAVAYLRALRGSNVDRFHHLTVDELVRSVPALSPGEARQALREVRG